MSDEYGPMESLMDLVRSPGNYGDSTRQREQYGDVTLSIVAGYGMHSTPRRNGLAMPEYSAVEVGILDKDGELVHPSAIGIPDMDDSFECGPCPVAPYVSWDQVNALRVALATRAALTGAVSMAPAGPVSVDADGSPV